MHGSFFVSSFMLCTATCDKQRERACVELYILHSRHFDSCLFFMKAFYKREDAGYCYPAFIMKKFYNENTHFL